MATAKALRTERMNQAAARLDFLADNARILRDPAAWKAYTEAVKITELLGYQVKVSGSQHEVTPC